MSDLSRHGRKPPGGPDDFDTVHQYADKRGYKVELHKLSSGWLVRLGAKDGKTQGEAKGRSPSKAYEALVKSLGLKVEA